MKAILVIDIDDEEIEDLGVNYLLFRASDGKVINGDMGVILKPMPSFKAIDLNDTRDVVMFCYGWNACVEEITGETE